MNERYSFFLTQFITMKDYSSILAYIGNYVFYTSFSILDSWRKNKIMSTILTASQLGTKNKVEWRNVVKLLRDRSSFLFTTLKRSGLSLTNTILFQYSISSIKFVNKQSLSRLLISQTKITAPDSDPRAQTRPDKISHPHLADNRRPKPALQTLSSWKRALHNNFPISPSPNSTFQPIDLSARI